MYNLAPLTTVNQVIRDIPAGTPNHDIRLARPQNAVPYSGDAPLPRCITTSGGQNYHPSGTRDFTHREFACLQGFPLDYEFVKTSAKRQIGNAVPPSISKVFLEECKKALMQADGII